MVASKSLVIDSEICSGPITQLSGDFKQRIHVKREELCHPIISGNKWHKLRLNLAKAKEQSARRVISFGGAWSNHIHALAYACYREGLACHAYIRGEELAYKPLNATLQDVSKWGAQLHFLSRGDYARRYDKDFVHSLLSQHAQAFLIEEGGANEAGATGCAQFARQTLEAYRRMHGGYPDVIALAAGTGTMAAGFLQALDALACPSHLHVYLALQDRGNIEKRIRTFSGGQDAHLLHMHDEYCFGGFAKTDAALDTFMDDFKQQHGIALDPVYTAKLFYGVMQDLGKGLYPEDASLLLVHSGGLQGKRSRE